MPRQCPDVTVDDDTPVAISPQHASLTNNANATVTVALDGDGEIDTMSAAISRER